MSWILIILELIVSVSIHEPMQSESLLFADDTACVFEEDTLNLA